jgi:tetratricopeptide (TPR) repeat protein
LGLIGRGGGSAWADKPALGVADVLPPVDLERAKGLRVEAFRGLEELVAATGKDDPERPALLFRLGSAYDELAWGEWMRARALDDTVADCKAGRTMGAACAGVEARRAALDEHVMALRVQAVKQWTALMIDHAGWERMDEALYALGYLLHELGKDDRALDAYRKLVKEHPASKHVPDALLAFAEHWFDEGRIDEALRGYAAVTGWGESRVYGYALYKEGWCWLNEADYEAALRAFAAVIAHDAAGAGKGEASKIALAREAKKDLVRAFAHVGTPGKALAFFRKVAGEGDAVWMLERLAETWFDDGRWKDAIAAWRGVIALEPASAKNHAREARIVRATLPLADRGATVKELRRLGDLLDVLAKGGAARAVVDEARRTTADLLRETATGWHRDAAASGDRAAWAAASVAYEEYLRRFSDAKDAGTMTYFWADALYAQGMWSAAGDRFLDALKKDPHGPHAVEAAKAAVLAYRHPGADDEKLARACEAYLEYLPDGDHAVDAMLELARLHREHGRLAAARPLLARIVDEHPDHALAPTAALWLLDVLRATGDDDALLALAARLRAIPALYGAGDAGPVIDGVLEWGAYRRCVKLVEGGADWASAGLCFDDYAADHPKAPRLYDALVNAAVAYEKAHRVGLALKARESLAVLYPDRDAGRDSLFAAAAMYMDLGLYNKASARFEEFAARYPASPHACGALGNAALFAEGLGEHDRALALSEKFVAACAKDKKEACARTFRTAALHEAKGDAKGALVVYDGYVKRCGRAWSLDDYFAARLALAKGRLGGAGAPSGAEGTAGAAVTAAGAAAFAAIRDEFDRLPPDAVARAAAEGSLGPAGRDAVAEAAFRVSEPVYEEFLAVKLPTRLPADPVKLRAALADWFEEKTGRLASTRDAYGKVLHYGSLEWGLAALCRIGEIYDNFSRQLLAAPIPGAVVYEVHGLRRADLARAGLHDKVVRAGKGGALVLEHVLSDAEKDGYRAALEKPAYLFEEKAVDGFRHCVETAAAKEWFNAWSKRCEAALGALEPVRFPPVAEIVAPAERHAVEVVLARPVGGP